METQTAFPSTHELIPICQHMEGGTDLTEEINMPPDVAPESIPPETTEAALDNDINQIMKPSGTIGGVILEEYADLSDGDSYCADLWEDMVEEDSLDPSPHAYYVPFRRYMAKILSMSARKFLSDHLNPEIDHLSRQGFKKNWCGLVECMDKNYEYVVSMDRFKDPTHELLMDWQTEDGSTIGRLLTYLTKMDRYDIIDDIGFMDMIKRSAQAYDEQREDEARKREERRLRRIAMKRGLPAIRDGDVEEYGAFICYDEVDSDFVKELIWECEELNHKKICTSVWDLLVGQNEEYMTAEMIKKRCGRTIIVLSDRFCTDNSPMYQYAMKVAQALSPATASGGNLIPIKLDNCEIPNSLMYINPVDFSRCREPKWLWRKITGTLKRPHGPIAMMERQRLRHVLLYADNRQDLRAIMKAESYEPPPRTPLPARTPVTPKPQTPQDILMLNDNTRAELRRPPYLKDPVLTVPQQIRRKFRQFFKLENAWDPEFRY